MKRIWLFLALLLLFGTNVLPVQAALPVEEASLKAGGSPYEINAYSDGWLWITDYSGDIWQVNPLTRDYVMYQTRWEESPGIFTLGNPSDARRSGDYFWWADGGVLGMVGRAAAADGEFTLWAVPGAEAFYGTAAASDSQLWFTDAANPYFYSLSLNQPGTSGTLCSYSMPISGTGYYLVLKDGYLWMGVSTLTESRILRLTVANNRLDWWELPEFSDPFGLVLGTDNFLWFTDSSNDVIAKLDSTNHTLYSYLLPDGTYPNLVTVQEQKIWFSGFSDSSVGWLDPATAVYTDDPLPTAFDTLTPACTSITPTDYTPGEADYLPMVSGSIGWFASSYSPIHEGDGWSIFQLPGSSSGAWGITTQGENIFIVDSGNQKLVKINPPAPTASITACKLQDTDGNLQTVNDRAPVAGWGMTLYKDNVSQGQQVTDANGCTSWAALPLEAAYKGSEEARSGWSALTGVECDKGVITAPGSYNCEFVNWQPPLYQVFLPLIRR